MEVTSCRTPGSTAECPAGDLISKAMLVELLCWPRFSSSWDENQTAETLTVPFHKQLLSTLSRRLSAPPCSPFLKGQQATPASCFTPSAALQKKLGLCTLLVQELAFQFSASTGSAFTKRPSLDNSSRLLPKATAFQKHFSCVLLKCNSFPSMQQNSLTEVLEKWLL